MSEINRYNSPIKAQTFRDERLTRCRYKAVFFDLDGTLVDTVPHICASYRHTYESLGLTPLDDESVMAGIGLPLLDFIQAHVPETFQVQFLKEYRRYNEVLMFQNTAVFWPVMPILEQLRNLGVMMGVVTAKGRKPAEMNLAHYDLLKYFSLVITNEDTSAHKPDPTPLLVAAEQMQVLSGESFALRDMLYVGDARYDVACAKNAGCDAALVQWTRMPLEAINEAGPYFILQNAIDLA